MIDIVYNDNTCCFVLALNVLYEKFSSIVCDFSCLFVDWTEELLITGTGKGSNIQYPISPFIFSNLERTLFYVFM